MRGGVAGKGRRGGKGGVDAEPAPNDVHFFRHAGSTGVTSGYLREVAYQWGRHTYETLDTSNFSPGLTRVDTMICIPQIFPQTCKLSRILFRSHSGAGNGLRFGIYANKRDLLLYPGDRVWKSADYTPTALQKISATVDIGVEGGSLLWLALQYDPGSSAVETRGQHSNEMLVMGGMPPDGWLTGVNWSADATMRPFVGWQIPRTYAAGLPTTAPTGVGETPLPNLDGSSVSYPLPLIGYVLKPP